MCVSACKRVQGVLRGVCVSVGEVGGSVGERLETGLLERVLGHRLSRRESIRLLIQLRSPHTTLGKHTSPHTTPHTHHSSYNSSYNYTCVLIPIFTCPHAAIFVSSLYYVCVLIGGGVCRRCCSGGGQGSSGMCGATYGPLSTSSTLPSSTICN